MNIQENLERFFSIIDSFKKEQSKSALDNYKGYQDLFNNAYFQSFLKSTPIAVAIYNFPNQKYDFVSESISEMSDCKQEDFMQDNGARGFVEAMDEISRDLMINTITPLLMQTCGAHSSEIKDVNFSACVSVKKETEKKWILLQTYILEATPDGFPLLSSTLVTDVSEIKKDSIIYYSAKLNKRAKGTEILYQKTFPEIDTELKLSAREIEIVQQICKGRTSKEIAENLNISFNTVKKHRNNILEKTGASNTPELINKATFFGLV